MADDFPENWSLLATPRHRVELVCMLSDLLDLRKDQQGPKSKNEINYIYHFLFDDTDLCHADTGELNRILLNREEAKKVGALVSLLDEVLKELGDASTAEFLSHSLWEPIKDATKEALVCLLEQGFPKSVSSRNQARILSGG